MKARMTAKTIDAEHTERMSQEFVQDAVLNHPKNISPLEDMVFLAEDQQHMIA